MAYLFNLKINPQYSRGEIPEGREGLYRQSVELLKQSGYVGEFCVQDNGRMERGFREGLPVKEAKFDISERELSDIDAQKCRQTFLCGV